MSSWSRGRTAAALSLVLALPLWIASTSSTASAAAPASLQVSPKVYVGGQLLTFEGNLGVSGKRRIHLESLAGNRVGANWVKVPGSGAETAADGSFEFRHPAPSMFNKTYRVVSGGARTPGELLKARSQDVVLWAPGEPVAGEYFTIVASTTPGGHHPRDHGAFIPKRPDLPPPVFEGRDLTLQRWVDGRWNVVGRKQADQDGEGRFTVTVPSAGTAVFRVIEEDWPQAGGPDIGWMASFPTPIRVAGSRREAQQIAAEAGTSTAWPATAAEPAGGARVTGGEANTTAAEKFGWRPSQWDFAWIAGESLESPPYRGRNPVGWWLDSATGLGRAAKHNGGLSLESSRTMGGPGDHGTTSATLQDNSSRLGRWEVRVRAKSVESNARDFRQLVELVPAGGGGACTSSITVASFTAHGRVMKFGATSANGSRRWTGSTRLVKRGNVNNVPLAFAVEVGRRHVSFFQDGRVVGTAPRGAVPRGPMTLRVSQAGSGSSERNATEATYDWMRGFTIGSGKQVRSGKGLRSRAVKRC